MSEIQPQHLPPQNQGEFSVAPNVIEGLKAEILDPTTTHERVEEILQFALDLQGPKQPIAEHYDEATPDWASYTREELARIFSSDETSKEDQDSIASYVESIGQSFKKE